ncbi:MAG TPA: hypothetical protein VFJ90_05785, partial [Candidatus Didemnitutus sp.]|nr:hypothetical protein [Candidatus Didemnitutus sp.]
PLTEAQNLDTASSWRRRTELGLALAGAYQAAGQGAQAKLMTEYVRKLESDVATRGPDIAVTTYAAVGGLFGYQIGPALRGLADPSDPKSRAAYVLQRQSFPVLLLIGLEQVDSQPLVVVDVTVRRVEVLLPQFRLTSTARWMPLTSQNYRFNELQRLNVAYELGEAEGYFDGHNGAADKVGLMHTRELMHLVNGAVVTITMPAPLPEPPKPGVPTGVKLNPASVTLDRGSDGNPVSRKVSFVITGKDLTKSTAATLKIAPERIVTFSTPESLKGAITVEADVTGADGPLVFTAATSDEADAPRFLLGAVPVTINQPGYVTYTETGPGKDAVVTRKLEVDGTPPAAFLNATNSLIAGKSSGASDQNTSSTPTGGSASIKLDVQASQPDKK